MCPFLQYPRCFPDALKVAFRFSPFPYCVQTTPSPGPLCLAAAAASSSTGGPFSSLSCRSSEFAAL